MNSNRVYIHGYCSPCKPFFYFIFSLLYQTTSLPQPLQQLVRQNQLKINQTHLLKINQNQPSINWKLTQNQQKINPNTSTQRYTCLKKNTERSELIGTISAWLEWSELVGMGLAWLVLVDRSCGDRCLPDRSCGSVLVTEMVWIRSRGRVDSETSWI